MEVNSWDCGPIVLVEVKARLKDVKAFRPVSQSLGSYIIIS